VHTQIQIVLCPQCGAKVAEAIFHDGFRSGSTTIGPAWVPCGGCGCPILTGQTEWDDKSFVQRLWFVIQRAIWLLISSLVFAGTPAFIIGAIATEHWHLDRAHENRWRLRTYGVGTAILGCVFFYNAAKEIRESRRRTGDVSREDLM
jgi:hypothetical protein